MNDTREPLWRLPDGLTQGIWEYAQSDRIADDYDNYFEFNKLFELDVSVLAERFELGCGDPPPLVADLGCGTGRALLPLAEAGFRGLAVDLSQRMLDIVKEKASGRNLSIQYLKANLVELDCLEDHSVDYAISLFSTLGMICGRQNRHRALSHARRILKPGGLFVLHVHNFWYNLYEPGGAWWIAKNYLRSWRVGDIEPGDKIFPYRGLPNMFLHVFSSGELRRDLKEAGFSVKEMLLLAPQRNRQLSCPWAFGALRANGWIVVCQ